MMCDSLRSRCTVLREFGVAVVCLWRRRQPSLDLDTSCVVVTLVTHRPRRKQRTTDQRRSGSKTDTDTDTTPPLHHKSR